MKGYGLPRHKDLEYPDKLDITIYGLKTECYGEKRHSKSKRRFRRIWKKKERAKNKRELLGVINV